MVQKKGLGDVGGGGGGGKCNSLQLKSEHATCSEETRHKVHIGL